MFEGCGIKHLVEMAVEGLVSEIIIIIKNCFLKIIYINVKVFSDEIVAPGQEEV